MIRKCWAAVLMLVMAGCGPIYETVYSYQPPRSAEGRMCTSQCHQINQYCKQNCELREQTCQGNAQQEANRQYDSYVRERRRAHLEIKKSPSDFYSSYGCSSSSSCSSACDSNYRMCYTNCGGTITSHQECTMFCDQQGTRAPY